MEPGLTPVMSKLEILVQMWGETVMMMIMMMVMMMMMMMMMPLHCKTIVDQFFLQFLDLYLYLYLCIFVFLPKSLK